jgi:hypothetical protein
MFAARRKAIASEVKERMNAVTVSLPILHAGHPIWYQGRLVGIAADGEVYTVGWIDPSERSLFRALGAAVLEAPSLDADGQFSLATYCLLPDEIWLDREDWPDELIARTVGVPLDVVHRRRDLPPLGANYADTVLEPVCA